MNIKTIKLATAGLIILVANTSMAQDGHWSLRGLVSFVGTSSNDDLRVQMFPAPQGQERLTHGVSSGSGAGLGFEYRWTDRIGIEGLALLTYHDSDISITNDLGRFSASDTTRFRIFTLGANYYFKPRDRMQWSVGGFLPLMFADGTDHVFPGLNRTESRAYDQDYGIGVKAAMDWSFSADNRWALTVDARYMGLLIMESETGGDVSIDPLLLSVSLGYRF